MGQGIGVVLLTKEQVLQRLREHRKVPGWRSEGKDTFTRELRKLLSHLNETRGGSLKIDAVSESVWSNLKFLRMMVLTWRLFGWWLFSFGLSGFQGRLISLSMFQYTGDNRARVTTFCKESTHLIGLRNEIRIIAA